MDKVRFGVIGCADIARRTFIPALRQSNCAQLVAVASRNADKAGQISREFCCEPVHGYDALLEREDIDAVYIATPTGQHEQWVKAAAARSKHVLCEKSLTTDAATAAQLVELCQHKGIALLEGFAYQFHPQHGVFNSLVEGGRIGEPILFQARFGFPPLAADNFRYRRELGGGALLDAGAYTVHAARRFFGCEPQGICASLDCHGSEVDIRGSAMLDFGQGRSAQLCFGFDHAYSNTYTVWGSRGQLTLQRTFSIPPTLSPTMVLETQHYRQTRELQACNHFLAEIRAFCLGMNSATVREAWRSDALGQAQALEAIRNNGLTQITAG